MRRERIDHRDKNQVVRNILLKRRWTDLEWSLKVLNRIPLLMAIAGAVVSLFGYDSKNGNLVFGLFCMATAVLLFPMFRKVRETLSLRILLISVGVGYGLTVLEWVVWGIPNDFLQGYDIAHLVYSQKGYAVCVLADVLPWIYLFIRVAFLFMMLIPIWYWSKFRQLPEGMKNQFLAERGADKNVDGSSF